jgi:flagellar M-ring protein FliF
LTTLNNAISTPMAPAPLPALQAMAPSAAVEGGGGESLIDIRSVQGRVKESSVKKVQEVVDQNPEESLNVVRGWMAGNTSSGEG